MKKIRVSKKDVGRWCLVHFDDIGFVTGLITKAEADSDWIGVFLVATNATEQVSREQIVRLGSSIEVPSNALSL